MILLSLLIGIVAGLRALVAVAFVSWAIRLGIFDLQNGYLAFLGYRWTPLILTIAAIGELISDKLPHTPSRKVPAQFGARIVSGALAGGAIGAATGNWLIGGILGILGAFIGTLSGATVRAGLAKRFKRDLPAALFEDVVAILAALAIVMVI